MKWVVKSKSLRGLSVAVVAGLIGVLLGPLGQAEAATVGTLAGTGTVADPVVIDSAADLTAAANAVNTTPATYAGLAYRLGADINYGGATFPTFHTFTGSFDGNGHSISNIGGYATSTSTGFFRSATNATIRDLTLVDVTVTVAGGDEPTAQYNAGILVDAASGVRVSGNSILDSRLELIKSSITSTSSRGTALVNRNTGGTSVIADNYLDNVDVIAKKYPAAILNTVAGTVSVERNLIVDTRLNEDTQGNAAAAAFVVLAPNASTTVRKNVVHSGWIYMDGNTGAGRTFYTGWVSGNAVAAGYSENLVNSNNNRTFGAEGAVKQAVKTSGTGPYDLAWDSDIALQSVQEAENSAQWTTWVLGHDGIATTPAQLRTQSTYAGIGWTFESGSGAWRWESVLGHPVPAKARIPAFMQAGVTGSGTSASPYVLESKAHLEAMQTALAGDYGLYGGRFYRLGADIDLGGAEFTGLDKFSGTLNGDGHTISHATWAPSATSADLAFIRTLHGTVRGVTFEDIELAPSAGTQKAAGVALTVSGTSKKAAAITQVQVRDSVFEAPGALLGAGIAAEVGEFAAVHDNDLEAVVTAGALAGGIAGQVSHDGTIEHNLVRQGTDVSADDHGAVVGADLGPETTVGGNVVVGRDGADVHTKSTYTGLGWDFVDVWMWDVATLLPRIKYVAPEEMPNRITSTFYGDPQTQRAFTWYQAIEGAVEPGAMLSTDPRFPDAATTYFEATSEESNEGETIYRAIATELVPGATYYYRVGDTFTGKWSENGTFRTADGDDDFTFIGLTDTQARGGASEAAVSANTMRQALKTAPGSEFILHAGDVVQLSDDELDWRDLFAAAQDSLLANTIAPVAGNHDGKPDEFTQHFTLEAVNGQDTSAGVYYSYDYNRAHFAMLNTNEGNGCVAHDLNNETCEIVSDEQIEWLRDDVKAARARGAEWIVVTTHKGPYTAGNHPFDTEIMPLRERLVPVIDELDIDLVIQGHDHYWTRTKELFSDPGTPVKARVADPGSDVIEEVNSGIHIEYRVDQQGTMFINPGTAGAKHYGQLAGAQPVEFDTDSYLDLFERLGGGIRFASNSRPSYLTVKVTGERLTVKRHEFDAKGNSFLGEGFGIDRAVSAVDSRLTALPDAADIVLDDEPTVAQARAAVRGLTKAQRAALDSLARLEAAENALRVLHGVASADGGEVAWADPGATQRQPVTVTNDQRRDLTDVPVRLLISDTPEVTQETFGLYTQRSVPISFEVETWQPGGTSVVWAKLESLKKQDSKVVWAYFGGLGAPDNDPREVWSNQFHLVEHFADDGAEGEALPDSTGQVTGTLVGSDLESVSDSDSALEGSGSVRFDSSRLQYNGNIGADNKHFTVSGIFALTPEDLAAITGETAVLVGRNVPGASDATMEIGIRKADGLFSALTPFDNATSPVPKDAEPHLVTVTFDDMTYATFVDGVETSEQLAEWRQFPNLFDAPTTIGDTGVDPDDPNRLLKAFHGVVDELWIAGTQFIPELEAFRADNYFGDAVRFGKREQKEAEELVLALGTPGDGAEVEAGTVDVFGSVSKRSVLTARIGGETVFTQQVEAGVFSVPVPVLTTGEGVQVTFTATATADPELVSEPSSLSLDVTDTRAPNTPATSAERPANAALSLKVSPQTDVPEKVSAQYYVNESVALDGNVSVATGETAAREPSELTPYSGKVTDELTPTVVGEDKNPYQVYRITLTEEQAAEGEWHFSWRGKADKRTVSAWVWDNNASKWVLKESDASPEGDTVNLDVRTTGADHSVSGARVLTVLIWRGLTDLPWSQSTDFDDRVPSADDFDWSFNHVGDTQLYAQATPWAMTEQFDYIAEKAAERKTAMVIQAGDWINREEFEDEWMWRGAEPSAQALEEADIPFGISWGNHDYNESYNGRQMIQKYFPMKRFEQSLEGSPWTFGGSQDIDNYFYTGEISGAKVLWLQLGFWSSEVGQKNFDAGIAWAQQVIESHPEYSVILSTHHHMYARDANDPYSNPVINEKLIDPYENVKLALSGHQSGTFVASRTRDGGSRVFAILTDYQTRAWGGHGFLKNLSVDAENNLIYVNTYSPWLQTTTSDGRWNQGGTNLTPITPGFHGDNSENYVIEVDLGGTQQRTLETSRVTFSSGAPGALGDPLKLVGAEAGVMEFAPDLDTTREWYAVLTDEAGNSTTSKTNLVRRVTTYDLGYDLAGGSLAEDANPGTYTAEDDLTLEQPTREGYTFTGWTGTGLSAPTTTVRIAEGSSGDRSYVAHWELTRYSLGYDLAGGYLTGTNPSQYTIESEALALSNPRRSGYTFAGWTGTSLPQATSAVTIPTGSTGARSYVATWVVGGFPISYDLGGGMVTGNPATYTLESRAFTLTNPTRPDHAFTGWTGTGLPETTMRVTVEPGTRGALTFVATWRALPQATPSLSVRLLKTPKGRRKPAGLLLTVATAANRSLPTGRVTVKLTKKVRGRQVTKKVRGTLTGGRVTIRLPKRLARGTWKIATTYAGDANYRSKKARKLTLRYRK